MATIGIIAKEASKEIFAVIESISSWANKNDHKILLEKETATFFKSAHKKTKIEKLASESNLIITLGGDGTLIRIAKYAAKTKSVIIGVNFGNLGFLTEITPKEVLQSIQEVLNGSAPLAKREMLQVKVERKGKEVFSSICLNDAVILKSSMGTLIDLDVAKDKSDLMRLRADGLIFATPTGSTAYSLAAGGSIVYPSLSVLLITPICPHSLTNRPLILPIDSLYKVKVPDYDGENIVLSVDGQEHVELKSQDKILITKADTSVMFVKSSTKNYFEILRTKLNWSIGNKLSTNKTK